jgi:undecaprenyl diphosphate synthase
VSSECRPKVGVFLSDGSRRSAMFFLDLQPNKEHFERDYIEIQGKKFLENVKIILQHGLHTLIIPALKHENFDRDKKNVDAIMYHGIKSMLTGKAWLEFYEKFNVKVKIYGDLNFIINKGYTEIADWVKEVEDRTKNNNRYRIFHGIACSNRYEHPRLMDLAVDFYIKEKRKPDEKEKIQLYYGDNIDDVDFLIRATEIRDSDLQPPIISGRRTQMYFLVAPDHVSFSTEVFREILYDLIYCRTSVFGKKVYKDTDPDENNINFMKKYYILNKSKVLGLGEKVGEFWVPQIEIRMPKNE